MDFFERLRRLANDVPWGTFASVMSENLGASSDAAEEIVDQLKQWGAFLTKNALSKWTVSVATAQACGSPDVSTGRPRQCASYAVVKCDVCGRPCCLAHARVDYMGDAICEVCIGEAKMRARMGQSIPYEPKEEPRRRREREAQPPPEPGPMTVAEARKALKLPKGAGWAETKAQYRKLVLKHNADRPQTDAEREKNTARLKKFNEAYAVLKAHYEKKREAA